jgi:flagellar biosynthesis component FlhA
MVFAPLFGAFVLLVATVVTSGVSEIGMAIAGGAYIGMLFGLTTVAVPAMVLAPATAMLMTRSNSDVDSRRYSLRVRRAVASVLGVVSLPLAFIMSQGLNYLLVGVAFAMFPLFVFAAAMAFGHIPVMYTREIFDPATTDDPSVLRRMRRRRAEARLDAMRPRIVALIELGQSDHEIGALVTWETGLEYHDALSRVAALRLAATPTVGRTSAI